MNLYMLVEGVKRKIKAAPRKGFEKLAVDADVSVPTLYAIIADRRMPSIETLQKLCDHFGIKVSVVAHETVQHVASANDAVDVKLVKL